MGPTITTTITVWLLLMTWFLVVASAALGLMVFFDPVYAALELDPLEWTLLTMGIAILGTTGLVYLIRAGSRRARARIDRDVQLRSVEAAHLQRTGQ